MLPCKFSSMPALSGHTDRVWDKSYMYCGNSHSLFILKGQHSLPAYHCCSCCRACYGIRLTGNDFLPKRSGTEHGRLHPERGNHSWGYWWQQGQGSTGLGAGHGGGEEEEEPCPWVTWQHKFHPNPAQAGLLVRVPVRNLLSPSQPAILIPDVNDHNNFHAVQPLARCKCGAWGCW